MAHYYQQQQQPHQQQQQQQQQPYGVPPQQSSAQNLQFYSSSYSDYGNAGAAASSSSYGGYGGGQGGASSYATMGTPAAFGGSGEGVSGRMGEQGGLRLGWLAAFSSEGYDGEPPLSEEVGFSFGHIRTKTLTVLNPFARIDQHVMDDTDLYGAFLYILLYGTFLLLSGKVFYGYIYGVAVFGSVLLHIILSLMSPVLDSSTNGSAHQDPASSMGMNMNMNMNPSDPSQAHGHGGHFSSTLTFTRSASVLGYCFLPLVLTSLVGIMIRMDTVFGYLVTTAAVGWCTYSSSGMFCAVGRMRGMRVLVAYPLALFYVVFGIMGIFSSRGGGTLVAKATKSG